MKPMIVVALLAMAFIVLELAERAEHWEGWIGDVARAWSRGGKVVGDVAGKLLFGFFMALLGLGFLILAVIGVLVAVVGLLSFS